MASAWMNRCESLRKARNECLGDWIDAPLRIDPNRTAIHYEGAEISYADVDKTANQIAHALIRAGLNVGDRVAVHVDNCPEFIYIFLGIQRAGAIAVPTNIMYTTEELEHILTDSGARALFILSESMPKVESLVSSSGDITCLVEVGGCTTDKGVALGDFVKTSRTDRPDVAVSKDDVALIQYTSGTTGRPKGAMLSHANILAALKSIGLLEGGIDFEEDDVSLLVLPLFHSYALDVCLGLACIYAHPIVLEKRFDAENVFRLIEQYRVTIYNGAPPMYHAFVNTPGLEKYDVSSLRCAFSGAAPLPVVILERFRDLTGVEILEGYGLTETAPTLSTNAAGPVNKPGAVGPPVPNVEMRIVDENDEDVQPGHVGEIVARGPNIFKGYWHRPEATAEAMRGGWFHTGDMGRMDEDGYYYIVDRKNDMIVVSGYNVYPIEIENVLLRHPKILDCAVIGMPDDYQGESVRACIVLHPETEMDAEEVIASCRDHLAAFKIPRSVSFRDSLPKNPTGKVLKRALRELEREGNTQGC